MAEYRKPMEHDDVLDDPMIVHNVDIDHLVNNGQGTYSLEEEDLTPEEMTIATETGTRLAMGTENDMEELQNGDFRDPGAGLTLKDSEGLENK